MEKYRGYELGTGRCGKIGVFAPEDWYQVDTAETVKEAKVKIDEWHAQWRELIAKDPTDGLAESCRKAIRDCGEEI